MHQRSYYNEKGALQVFHWAYIPPEATDLACGR